MGAAGTTTSALAAGGENASGTSVTTTESWTGAGQPIGVWATGGSLNTARRQLAGAGLQGAALAFGGVNPSATQAVTESYNGSSWTEVNDLNTCLLYTSPSPRDRTRSRMPSSA